MQGSSKLTCSGVKVTPYPAAGPGPAPFHLYPVPSGDTWFIYWLLKLSRATSTQGSHPLPLQLSQQCLPGAAQLGAGGTVWVWLGEAWIPSLGWSKPEPRPSPQSDSPKTSLCMGQAEGCTTQTRSLLGRQTSPGNL